MITLVPRWIGCAGAQFAATPGIFLGHSRSSSLSSFLQAINGPIYQKMSEWSFGGTRIHMVKHASAYLYHMSMWKVRCMNTQHRTYERESEIIYVNLSCIGAMVVYKQGYDDHDSTMISESSDSVPKSSSR